MSSLRVLLLGNHPNIILFASRFQLANSVDLYHVSDSISNDFEVDTLSYGIEKFNLHNHFTSIQQLIDTNSNAQTFDLIILSASSLQELSSISSHLSQLTNSNSKIFVESSGSIQLEPFVRMSMNSQKSVNVLSIASDLDIRQINNQNKFKQFDTKPLLNKSKNSIFLGDSSLKSYTSTSRNLLDTFERLFTKLFPNESINLCGYSPLEFLKIEWSLALPKICFDPLLIMLEETNPKNLQNQILAKPLISGLVSEVITIINKMNVQLDKKISNETNLLNYWENLYDESKTPSLVYHFINKTSSLDIDLIWLQAILLADDHGIKTPYLEFLYSVISQFQKINNDDSKWFTRKDSNSSNNNNYREQLNLMATQKNSLENQLTSLQESLSLKDNKLKEYQSNINNLNNVLNSLKMEQNQVAQRYESQIQSLNKQINDLNIPQEQSQASIQDYGNQRTPMPKRKTPANNANDHLTVQSDGYKATGTPNLNDLETMAVFGVSYGDSPLKGMSKNPSMDQPTSSNGSATSQNLNVNSIGSVSSQNDGDNDNSIKERELELKKKELELQERELEIQRRALQQQQQQQHHAQPYGQQQQQQLQQQQQQPHTSRQSNMFNPGNNLNPINNRKSSYNQLQPSFSPNVRNGRNMNGSANNFIDPVASSASSYNGGFPQQQSQPQQYHSFKPTSRKNRNSQMPNLRNASNMSSFQPNSLNNGTNASMTSQSRLNSLSSQSLQYQNQYQNQNRMRQQQPQQLSMKGNNAINNNNNNGQPRTPVTFNQQQRQASSNSMDGSNVGNLSTNSVVHNSFQTKPATATPSVSVPLPTAAPISLSAPQSNATQQSQQPQLPQTNIHLSTPPIPQAASNVPESSPASFATQNTNDTTTTTDSEKKSKKKFGLFKKKNKQ